MAYAASPTRARRETLTESNTLSCITIAFSLHFESSLFATHPL